MLLDKKGNFVFISLIDMERESIRRRINFQSSIGMERENTRRRINFMEFNFAGHSIASKTGCGLTFEMRLHHLLKTLKMSKVDIFCLQEVDSNVYWFLKENMREYCFVCFPSRMPPEEEIDMQFCSGNEGIGVSTLIGLRKELLKVEKVTSYTDVCPGCKHWRRQTILVTDQLIVFSCHFPAPFRGKESRIVAAQNLAHHVELFKKRYPRRKLILCGDFNTVPDKDGEEALNIIRKRTNLPYHNGVPFIGFSEDKWKQPFTLDGRMSMINVFTDVKNVEFGHITPTTDCKNNRNNLWTDHYGFLMVFDL